MLAGVTCQAAYDATSEVKQMLADQLAACPFERMTDDYMIELALLIADGDEVARIVQTVSPARYEMQPVYHLCPDCADEHVLFDAELGRWVRCERCNPRRVVEQIAKSRAKFKGKPDTIEADEADEAPT
jgi:hypothetical protein